MTTADLAARARQLAEQAGAADRLMTPDFVVVDLRKDRLTAPPVKCASCRQLLPREGAGLVAGDGVYCPRCRRVDSTPAPGSVNSTPGGPP